MTPQQLIGLAVRFFAIWLAITSASYLTSIPKALQNMQPETGASIMAAYGLGVGYLIGALVLWFCPMLVAHKLLPRTQYENRLSFQAHELARVGCALVGLWLFAQALPSLVWVLFRSFLFIDAGSSFSSLTPEARLDVFVALFQAGFALVVIFKAKVFANFVIPETTAQKNAL